MVSRGGFRGHPEQRPKAATYCVAREKKGQLPLGHPGSHVFLVPSSWPG